MQGQPVPNQNMMVVQPQMHGAMSHDTYHLSEPSEGGRNYSEASESSVTSPRKAAKKAAKKQKQQAQETILLLPLMMYAGSGRLLLTADGKRSFIKLSQVQELVLHTIPIYALMVYNNNTDIIYNNELKQANESLFPALFTLTLFEIVIFYCKRVGGDNLEKVKMTGKAKVAHGKVKNWGYLSILLATAAVLIGFIVFKDEMEQGCLNRWFIDEEVICKDCVLHFGE
jgi:hypothetical protein